MFFCENTRQKMSADALGYERFPGIMSDRKDPNTLKPSGAWAASVTSAVNRQQHSVLPTSRVVTSLLALNLDDDGAVARARSP